MKLTVHQGKITKRWAVYDQKSRIVGSFETRDEADAFVRGWWDAYAEQRSGWKASEYP